VPRTPYGVRGLIVICGANGLIAAVIAGSAGAFETVGSFGGGPNCGHCSIASAGKGTADADGTPVAGCGAGADASNDATGSIDLLWVRSLWFQAAL
jgi:hypothetical protein